MNTKYKTQLVVKVTFCSFLLILPSCGIPCLRQAEPGPVLPTEYNQANSPEAIRSVASSSEASEAGASEKKSTDMTVPESKNPEKKDAKTKDSEKDSNAKGTETKITGANNLIVNSSENSALFGIEVFYRDPILMGLIHKAVVSNRELKILDEEVQIAKNEILARQGAYLPFFTVGAGGGLSQYSRYTLEAASIHSDPYINHTLLPTPLPNSQLGLNLTWQLDIWRQLRNARDAAAQRYVSASEKRSYFVTRLVAETAENYYKLMALDQRIKNLDKTIDNQQQSLKIAKARLEAGRDTELAVQRFQAEVRKNQSEKLIVKQEIVEVENRINFLVNRFPEPVERMTTGFFDLELNALSLGVPSQLLQNRPDIRQAERELEANGLDVKVAKARFYPTLTLTGGVGFQAFNPAYLVTNPIEALAANVAGGLVAPLINKKAIQADYMTANARQLESVYNYQRVVLNAFIEVINRTSKVENYRKSIEIKKQQLESLEAAVEAANKLFQNARVEYVEVLLAQNARLEARMVLIETKNQELSAIVNVYQALGGGLAGLGSPNDSGRAVLLAPR